MPILVEMDEFILTTDPEEILITEGVSTCIAFAANGFYFSEDEDENEIRISFGALYHWSGFVDGVKDVHGHTKDILKYFLSKIHSSLGLDDDQCFTISSLHLIGGEKKQVNERGDLLVSGTEKEVEALQHTLKYFKWKQKLFNLEQEAIKQSYFLTKNEDTINVYVQTESCRYFLDSAEEEEKGNDSSMHPTF